MKTVEVVAAIIILDGRALCTQRGLHKFGYLSGKFEFPGGKVEPGESNEAALAREIAEELKVNVVVGPHLTTVAHQYPDFAIELHSYICQADDIHNLQLTEHIAHKWLPVDQLSELDWAAADIPIVEKLQSEPNEFF